jgi:hypothetical protein
MRPFRRHRCALLFVIGLLAAPARAPAQEPNGPFAVGPQYDTTHVYVPPDEFERFVASFKAVFGGTASKQGVYTVTPTPSRTKSQLVLTPAGTISVFGFVTPIPYPFGAERTGYLVTDLPAALQAAREAGAGIAVAEFPDAIGRDAVVQWPGGVKMQLYWHTVAPHYATLATIPENRVYVAPEDADAFVRAFISFSAGHKGADDKAAPGAEIGRRGSVFRRIEIESGFGKIAVLATDGHLPYPYGHELTGYEVPDIAQTIRRATAAGVSILTQPTAAGDRTSAMLMFPGGYIAEVHSHRVK